MDLRMLVMNRITAAVKIHQVFPELPLVAFSAEDSEEAQAKALGVLSRLHEKARERKRGETNHRRSRSAPVGECIAGAMREERERAKQDHHHQHIPGSLR